MSAADAFKDLYDAATPFVLQENISQGQLTKLADAHRAVSLILAVTPVTALPIEVIAGIRSIRYGGGEGWCSQVRVRIGWRYLRDSKGDPLVWQTEAEAVTAAMECRTDDKAWKRIMA